MRMAPLQNFGARNRKIRAKQVTPRGLHGESPSLLAAEASGRKYNNAIRDLDGISGVPDRHRPELSLLRRRKNAQFRGDKPGDNGDNPLKLCREYLVLSMMSGKYRQ
jgi:hypothetical protein